MYNLHDSGDIVLMVFHIGLCYTLDDMVNYVFSSATHIGLFHV